MNKEKAVLWIVLFVMLTMALMNGPDLWAAPGQSPARQTVPTRTPVPSPTEPPPPPTTQPMPTPTALAVSSTASAAAHAEASSQPILPEAGGWSIRLYLSAAMIAVGLLVLVVVGRRA
ncbi:MAG: hypothetical protein KAX24_01035 [Anaerolineae bacterium]|nr:hypothetical protein [Anaerolineae bacterium]